MRKRRWDQIRHNGEEARPDRHLAGVTGSGSRRESGLAQGVAGSGQPAGSGGGEASGISWVSVGAPVVLRVGREHCGRGIRPHTGSPNAPPVPLSVHVHPPHPMPCNSTPGDTRESGAAGEAEGRCGAAEPGQRAQEMQQPLGGKGCLSSALMQDSKATTAIDMQPGRDCMCRGSPWVRAAGCRHHFEAESPWGGDTLTQRGATRLVAAGTGQEGAVHSRGDAAPRLMVLRAPLGGCCSLSPLEAPSGDTKA